MSPITALYARVSSQKQAEDGTIESQLSTLDAYCKHNGFVTDKSLIFVDNGVSGSALERPALDALRDTIVSGKIDQVLVLSPDRLARKHAHQFVLLDEFARLGIAVIFVNRSISESPEDQLLLQVQGAIAEYEREKIAERARRGKIHKAQKGDVSVMSGAPYGYLYLAASPQREASYEINLPQARVIRQIFAWYTQEQIPMNQIAKRLTNEQIRSPGGGPIWHRSVLSKILRNPAYMGQAAYRKTKMVARKKLTRHSRKQNYYTKTALSSKKQRPREEWIAIKVPAVISEEMFQRAQEQLQLNKKFARRNNSKHLYLLSGLLYCEECYYNLQGRGSTYRYYRCAGAENPLAKHHCHSSAIRVEPLDEMVWQQVKQLIQSPKRVFNHYLSRVDQKQNQSHSFEALFKQKNKEIHHYEQQKEKLLDLYQNQLIAFEEIQPRLQSIQKQIKDLQQEQTLIQQEQTLENQKLQLIENFESFKETMTENLDQLEFEKKRQIVRLLVKEIAIDPKTQTIRVKHIIPSEKNFTLCPPRMRGDDIEIPISSIKSN